MFISKGYIKISEKAMCGVYSSSFLKVIEKIGPGT